MISTLIGSDGSGSGWMILTLITSSGFGSGFGNALCSLRLSRTRCCRSFASWRSSASVARLPADPHHLIGARAVKAMNLRDEGLEVFDLGVKLLGFEQQ